MAQVVPQKKRCILHSVCLFVSLSVRPFNWLIRGMCLLLWCVWRLLRVVCNKSDAPIDDVVIYFFERAPFFLLSFLKDSMKCDSPLAMWEFHVPDDVLRLSVCACAAAGHFVVLGWCLLFFRKSRHWFMKCLASFRQTQGATDDVEQAVSDMQSENKLGITSFPFMANMLMRLHREDVWRERDLKLVRVACSEEASSTVS